MQLKRWRVFLGLFYLSLNCKDKPRLVTFPHKTGKGRLRVYWPSTLSHKHRSEEPANVSHLSPPLFFLTVWTQEQGKKGKGLHPLAGVKESRACSPCCLQEHRELPRAPYVPSTRHGVHRVSHTLCGPAAPNAMLLNRMLSQSATY